MKTISELEQIGFVGNDKSLAISLFEYGLAWQIDGADYRFFYAHPRIARSFDWACLPAKTTIARQWDWAQKEWNWVEWQDVTSFAGLTVEQLSKEEFPALVTLLVSYYGVEEIFGTSYDEGFQIQEDVNV